MTSCTHCNLDIPQGVFIKSEEDQNLQFCCTGCEAAYHVIKGLGLGNYYKRRVLDPNIAALKPEDDVGTIDYQAHAIAETDGTQALYMMVEGMHCAACVWLIETLLQRHEGVTHARLNMSTRRLVVKWQDEKSSANELAGLINGLGYRLVPYDPAALDRVNHEQEKELLRSMAVAGFAAGNVMLFSVSVWAGYFQGMLDVTREMMHWLSALIALPAVVYAGLPFYRSALEALRAQRVNMDVPISLAVILASGMSLYQTIVGAQHAYFDSAVGLLFFLLIGRYLDRRARGRAQSAAERLLALNARSATVIDEEGNRQLLPPSEIKIGMVLLVAPGERVAADGEVIEGTSDLDTSLITGESAPATALPGTGVFAGTNNLSAALKVKITASDKDTLLAEIVRLMEDAEQGRAKYVALADRVAKHYAPVVHTLALFTFLWWFFLGDALWQEALLISVAVLIITCPCALALAVPVVQVIASGRLLKRGIFVKSATALERIAKTDIVVFDKTGTLTLGKPQLVNLGEISQEQLNLAASIAAASKHPLARALCQVAPTVKVAENAQETPGMGMSAGDYKLGKRAWCEVETELKVIGPELWLTGPEIKPVRFVFKDQAREDAQEVVSTLKKQGKRVALLSGDLEPVVHSMVMELGIDDWQAECSPADKVARLAELKRQGFNVLMVGDGLNDAPALAAAHGSISPTTAADVSQTAADLVFQGAKLSPVLEALATAEKADTLVKQNFALTFLYNGLTIPLAVAGYVTPLIAAIAMSASSLVVIGNALRLTKSRKP
ncbi:MAG: heavy metal translocating P-type ATPase metal-binding domain-containing protein [Rhodospirillales bacterium]|nr:heavy metal translocating P-type ATPase metal-binding domain-containing protein [Rhodospirillales bacterium]